MKRFFLFFIFLNFAVISSFAADAPLLESQCTNQADNSDCPALGVWGELLSWKPKVSSLIFALTHTGPEGLETNKTLYNVNFCNHLGFRVGLGYTLPYNNWDTNFIYTRFNDAASSSTIIRTDSLDLHSTWEILGVVRADSAQASQCQFFQTFDAVLGKYLYVNCPFSLRYYFGIKSAWLKEQMNITYVGTTNSDIPTPAVANVTLTNSCKGIGFVNGTNVMWRLGYGFNLYSRGEFSVIQGNFSLREEELLARPEETPAKATVVNCNTIRSLKANFVGELGMRWKIDFCQRYSVSIYGGYEFNYWPSQILLTKVILLSPKDSNPAFLLNQFGDVGFQGFKFGASFEMEF